MLLGLSAPQLPLSKMEMFPASCGCFKNKNIEDCEVLRFYIKGGSNKDHGCRIRAMPCKLLKEYDANAQE